MDQAQLKAQIALFHEQFLVLSRDTAHRRDDKAAEKLELDTLATGVRIFTEIAVDMKRCAEAAEYLCQLQTNLIQKENAR